jgi:tRNA modification GTPase
MESIFGRRAEARAATRGEYRDRGGKTVDDVLFTFFAGPHSYTGEDVLEISSHGNPYIAQRILEDLAARGARGAEPGEFTRRAFLNGKLDLSQAEAVMDLIAARSERALAAAHRQLRGALTRDLDLLSRSLIAALAQVEAYIDFPDEDLPPENREALREALEKLQADTARLFATRHYGELLRDGVKVAIVGEPNAGKSSLLNRLVGRDRAIVSAEPGTTRDFLEERVMAGPHLFRLIDTAGLHPAGGEIERRGMEKTWERIDDSDIILLLLDPARPPPPWADRLAPRHPLVVSNKVDRHAPLPGTLPISALTGAGLAELLEALVARAEALKPDTGDEAVAINARHAAALQAARDCLAAAIGQLRGAPDPALLASDLRGALDAYGQIGGKIDHERVLDELFLRFCIGK